MPGLPADARRAARPALLGAALFLAACAVPGGLYTGDAPADVRLFQRFGERLLGGELPYRDFFVEYPPGALPVFVLPALGPSEDYALLFKLLMAALGAAAIGLAVVALAATGARAARLYAAAAFAGLAPLVLGPTVLDRYDLWPAALVSGALAALALGRARAGHALLALAIVAKGYAAVLLLPAYLHVRRRHGPEEARRSVVVLAIVAAAAVLPFAAVGAGGLRYALRVQLERGLHVESLGGGLLLALDRAGAASVEVVSGFAHELEGAGLVAAASSVVQLAAIAAAWTLYARGDADTQRLLLAAAAAVAAFVAFGKVLSPQFLVWLVPLVPLVAGRAGVAAAGLLVGALALTRAYFPGRYTEVVHEQEAVWLVLARDLVLVVLAVLLLVLLAQGRNTTKPAASRRS